MQLKNETQSDKSTETESEHNLETAFSTIMFMEATCSDCFMYGLSKLLNLGHIFADYVSVVTGEDGVEALIFPKEIFEEIELSETPESYLEEMLHKLQEQPEADSLHIVVSGFPIQSKAALLHVIKTYYSTKNSGYRPTPEMVNDLKKSMDRLPPEVAQKIFETIQKLKNKGN